MFSLDTAIRTAALVRENPLPVGRYWIDIWQREPDLTVWDRWLDAYQATARWVKVTTVEQFEPIDGKPGRAFVIFEVSDDRVEWGEVAKTLGFPNTAPVAIQSSNDTVQKPPPETNPLDDLLSSDNRPWLWVGLGATAAIAFFFVVRR